MTSFEIASSADNVYKLLVEDPIGRNQDIFSFSSILNSICSSFSISLDGEWGSGKTFFVKQTKLFLDACNEQTVNIDEEKREAIISAISKGSDITWHPQVCVYYDAWTNDNDIDPILSLIYTIFESTGKDFSISEAISDCRLLSRLFDVITGRQITAFFEELSTKDALEEIKSSRTLKEDINTYFKGVLAERGKRLIIFVDELDRCKPSFAIKLLEQIKHYFTNENITFVFSTNILELQHVIKRYYGTEFDAGRYLDKFFDLRISLPDVDVDHYCRSIKCFDGGYIYDKVCVSVIKSMNFTLREIARYVNITQLAINKCMHGSYSIISDDGRAVEFSLAFVLPILLGLKLKDINKHQEFINGNASDVLVDILCHLEPFRFVDLLSSEETFPNLNRETTNKQKIVQLKDKLKQVYEMLFVEDYSREEVIYIGRMEFTKETKLKLLRAESLLSMYIDLN